ncbi:5785_t:CDS:2, partial [Dentiscutata erythropus]
WFRYYYKQKEKLSQEATEKIIMDFQSKFEEIYIRFYYYYLYINTSIESNEGNLTNSNYQFDEDYYQYASK